MSSVNVVTNQEVICLQELLLNGNRIGHLRQCERYLPVSLVTLTLASNNLTDLNEISQLVQLSNLTNFSIASNPCVTMTGNNMYPLHDDHLVHHVSFRICFCYLSGGSGVAMTTFNWANHKQYRIVLSSGKSRLLFFSIVTDSLRCCSVVFCGAIFKS